MKKLITLSILSVLVIYSCKKSKDTQASTVVLDLPATPYSYDRAFPFAADSMNDIATLGRVLFYDGQLSVNNAISCGSCHKQAAGFADNEQFSTGFEGRKTGRNSPAISAEGIGGGSLFWDGREHSIKDLIMRPVTNHVEMGIDDPEKLPAKLSALPYYQDLFIKAYGDPAITVDRISNSVATFMQAMLTVNSRFDQFRKGNNTLTADEMEGMALFNTKYPCANCHNQNGGYFGGNSFRDIGLNATYDDLGRGAVTGQAFDNGRFKTPSLHNVALSGPYMHDGRFKTLEEVMDHYSTGIQTTPNLDEDLRDTNGEAMKMNITEHDKKAIIAFLNTFTDYTMVTDPKFSNPFKVK
jgi:cytochrome c peroxidase